MARPLFLLLALALVGCGSGGRQAMLEYREAFARGEWGKAASLLKKAGLEKEPKSRLLLLMEQGRLAYASGEHARAARLFGEAVELIDAQYTKSLTSETSRWFVNEANGEFFGAAYERSWLHYHLAMSHWGLYQDGKLPAEEARKHLFSARAALVAWDSFFQEWQRGTGGKSLYRHDLTAKVVAGQVHEATGVRADLQIALQLYRDAWNLLDALAPAYLAFNAEAREYGGQLATALAEEGRFSPPQKARSPTAAANRTREFLRDKILGLTARLRANELPLLKKQLGIEDAELKGAAKLPDANAVFLLEEGTVPPKSAETVDLGVKGLAKLSKDPKTQAQIAQVGSQVVAAFAVNVLGLAGGGSSPGRFVMAHDLTTVATHEFAIAFEVPVIPAAATPGEAWLVVRSTDGKIVERRPWALVTSLEDVARQSLEEEASQRILRTGVRVLMKHVTAILAAQALYQSVKSSSKDNEFLAKMAALGAYVAATKGIAASERADTRAWVTLPRGLRVAELKLAPGTYEAFYTPNPDEKAQEPGRLLGKVTVPEGKRAIFTHLVPQL